MRVVRQSWFLSRVLMENNFVVWKKSLIFGIENSTDKTHFRVWVTKNFILNNWQDWLHWQMFIYMSDFTYLQKIDKIKLLKNYDDCSLKLFLSNLQYIKTFSSLLIPENAPYQCCFQFLKSNFYFLLQNQRKTLFHYSY